MPAPQRYRPCNRRPVACALDQGPGDEELIERYIGVVDVTAGQAEVGLEVGRRNHLRAEHMFLNPRRVSSERVERNLQQRVALARPVRAAK